MVLSDETRTVELHHIQGLEHADGMLIAYLPKEKIIVQADMAVIGPFRLPENEHRTATLLANLERLKLDYERLFLFMLPSPIGESRKRISSASGCNRSYIYFLMIGLTYPAGKTRSGSGRTLR